MSLVELLDGPLAGQTRDVADLRDLVTFFWSSETTEPRLWDGVPVQVTVMHLETYYRVDATSFAHCRTPTTPGDLDLQFSERQLTLEEIDE
jgi:hypothetical protein